MMAQAAEEGIAGSMTLPLLRMFIGSQIVLALLLAGPCILTGIGLRRFQSWSRDLSMVVGVLLLGLLPIGTLVGLYSFWVVLSPEIEPLFHRRPAR